MTKLVSILMDPLKPYMSMPDVSEIIANEPMQICLERDGLQGWDVRKDPKLTYEFWDSFCRVAAISNDIQFKDITKPCVSTLLPGGHRLQATIGSGTTRKVGVAIRLRRPIERKLTDYGISQKVADELIELFNSGDCVCGIVGGTNSGKTTALNCILRTLKNDPRFVTIEDTAEIMLPTDVPSLQHLVNRNAADPKKVWTAGIDSIVRERPDVVVIGEISVHNAFPAIRLFNTGHSSVFCTVHANSPMDAINGAFPNNVQMAGFDAKDIPDLLKDLVDVFIQLKKTKTDTET